MRLFVHLHLFILITAVVTWSTWALADPGVVRLKDGRVLSVEIVELVEGQHVRIRGEDGVEIIINWDMVASIEKRAASPPPPVESEGPPEAGSPEVGPPGAEPPQPMSPKAELEQRIARLDRQIDRIDGQMPSIAGPIVLIAVGYGVGSILMLSGAAVAEECGEPFSGCYDREATPLFVAGSLGLALGTSGLIMLVSIMNKRKPYYDRIEPLERRREELEWELEAMAGPGRVFGTATLHF